MTIDRGTCVSIITPSYNQGEFLEQTIQSVLNQTYSNIEYIVIDGGSTDNSAELINKYKKEIAYWVSEPDDGQADAINKGFKAATGSLLCWINSDDILYPDFVADRVRQFEENTNAGMIYGDIDKGADLTARKISKGRQVSIMDMLKYASCPIPQQSAMWRRDVIEKIGYLDPQWHVVLDREYFIRTAAFFPIKYVAGAVAFFRNHENSKSIAEKLKWGEELPAYYEKVFNDDVYGLTSALLSYKGRCLSKVYLKCARIFTKAGDKSKAKEFYKKARRSDLINYIIDRYL